MKSPDKENKEQFGNGAVGKAPAAKRIFGVK
jgi:hypothetical protein